MLELFSVPRLIAVYDKFWRKHRSFADTLRRYFFLQNRANTATLFIQFLICLAKPISLSERRCTFRAYTETKQVSDRLKVLNRKTCRLGRAFPAAEPNFETHAAL